MTGLAKQAKGLTAAQTSALLGYVSEKTRFPERNRVIVLLGLKAGLRSQEIAGLTWKMLTDAEGNLSDEMRLTNAASKGASGRVIPLASELKKALMVLRDHERSKNRPVNGGAFVITLAKGNDELKSRAMSIRFLLNGKKARQQGWFDALGFEGCSSHSLRRTFITNAARNVSSVGGSMREVQELAGHASLAMTQRYVEVNEDAKKRLVNRV